MQAFKNIVDAIKPECNAVEVHPRDVVAVAEAIPADKRSGVVNTLYGACKPKADDPRRDARKTPTVVIFTKDIKTLLYEAEPYVKAMKPEATDGNAE